jgi:hypothetical protein
MDAEHLHRYGPWVLLALGVVSLLNVTVFYGVWQRLSLWLLAPERRERLAKHNPMLKGMGPVTTRALQSPAMRWLGVVQAVALLVGAALWFSLRP